MENLKGRKNLKQMTRQEKYAKCVIKPIFIMAIYFQKRFNCRDEKHQDQDEQASVPSTRNNGLV